MTQYALYKNDFFENKPIWMPKRLYEVVCNRSNPRSKEYMMALLEQEFPNTKLISIDNIPKDATQIILLYSDSIGLGFSYIEGSLIRKCKLLVLNGRRRQFALSIKMHALFCFKRFLEITFIPELFVAPFLLSIALLLASKDAISGILHDK